MSKRSDVVEAALSSGKDVLIEMGGKSVLINRVVRKGRKFDVYQCGEETEQRLAA